MLAWSDPEQPLPALEPALLGAGAPGVSPKPTSLTPETPPSSQMGERQQLSTLCSHQES